MTLIWDYNPEDLKKSQSGRLKILERMINYGIYPSDKEKIPLAEVKKNWEKLYLDPSRKRLFEFLIWGK